jgi:hypothetical protein
VPPLQCCNPAHTACQISAGQHSTAQHTSAQSLHEAPALWLHTHVRSRTTASRLCIDFLVLSQGLRFSDQCIRHKRSLWATSTVHLDEMPAGPHTPHDMRLGQLALPSSGLFARPGSAIKLWLLAGCRTHCPQDSRLDIRVWSGTGRGWRDAAWGGGGLQQAVVKARLTHNECA